MTSVGPTTTLKLSSTPGIRCYLLPPFTANHLLITNAHLAPYLEFLVFKNVLSPPPYKFFTVTSHNFCNWDGGLSLYVPYTLLLTGTGRLVSFLSQKKILFRSEFYKIDYRSDYSDSYLPQIIELPKISVKFSTLPSLSIHVHSVFRGSMCSYSLL